MLSEGFRGHYRSVIRLRGKLAWEAEAPKVARTNGTARGKGVQRFSFADTSNFGVLNVANDSRFFNDNTTEDSGGAAARIGLYAAGAFPGSQPTTPAIMAAAE